MHLFGKYPIYLDYASATPVLPEARDVVYAAMAMYANPGSIHATGVAAKRLLEDARERIAADLACKSREIIFAAGLTEANNIAIVGFARHLERTRRTLSGTHWLVASIEHSSVLECFSEVERLGGTVAHVDPLPNGLVTAENISAALRPETVFVSVGWGNNEIGTIQPLSSIALAVREHEKKHGTQIVFHSDAGQAPLYRAPQVHSLGVDLFSLGSGKLYGPRGIGALYVAANLSLAPVIFGGGQEKGLRSGTEEPALAQGFASALEAAANERGREGERLRQLRDTFAKDLQEHIPDIIVNGDIKHSMPHMLNLSIPGERTGEYLALQLDHAGIYVSTKSACDEGNKASHVVAALGGPDWRAINTLRFSFGNATTAGDARRALAALIRIVSQT